MGRPLRKANFGNTSGSNNQLQVLADIGAGPETCWIMDQPGSRTYTVASAAGGATPTRTGRVKLQEAAVTAEGQARLEVTPFGGFGTADGTAVMTALTAVVTNVGSGGYVVADQVTVVEGEQSEAALFDVNDLSTVAGQTDADFSTFVGGDGVGGTAAVVGDVYTMDDGSTVRVDSIDGDGDADAFTILTASTSGIIADDTVVLFDSLLSGTGNDISFTMTMETGTQGVFDVTVVGATDGIYSVIPTDPVTTTTGGAGAGVILNVDWGLDDITLLDGGDGYGSDPAITISGGGGANATADANRTGDAVTSVTITAAGTGFTSMPTVVFAAPAGGSSEYAYTVLQHRVKTWEGNTYTWKLDVAATAGGEADLQSA